MNLRSASVESYGCTMNQGEARAVESHLSSMGYRIIPAVDGQASPEADILVILTCCVIESTERRMIRRIRELASTGKQVYVGGCLASISAEDLIDEFPGLGILDTMGLGRLERSIRADIETAGPSIDGRTHPLDRVDQIVPISTGCLGACTYCITRLARGSLRSYEPSDIVGKIKEGIYLGRNEILLTSQDTGVYGLDSKFEQGSNLGSLLRYILIEVPGDYRIRIGMMNPGKTIDIAQDLIDGMDDRRIFKFLHIPVQSGSEAVLRAMRRPYRLRDFLDLVSDDPELRAEAMRRLGDLELEA
ncbi:MAG: radical SAM protein, partial [Thermoplasmatota archaeon]